MMDGVGVNRQPMGEILLERKVINQQQLQQALDFQKKSGGFLGEILVKLGHIDERDIVAALVVQYNFPYIAINKYELDIKLLNLVPEKMAREQGVVPLDRVGDVLSVVMDNPLNLALKEELEKITGCRVATFIATRSEIRQAVERWYNR